MLPVMDEIGIDVACVGNHDYVKKQKFNLKQDFGIEALQSLVNKQKVSFPWLLSNLFGKETKKPIAPGVEYYILNKNGLKIGFMGLIESDWVQTQNNIEPGEYIFEDFNLCAKRLIQFFKSNGCDLIIALTHMRNYNDM